MTFFYKSSLFTHYTTKVEFLIKRWNKERKKYLIYGAGTHTSRLLKKVKVKSKYFKGFIDQAKSKQKERFYGYSVYSIKNAARLNPDAILISSYEYQEKMERNIRSFFKVGNIEIASLYEKDKKHKLNSHLSFENAAPIEKKVTHKGMRKIAFIDNFFSWPPSGGSAVDLFNVMNSLTKIGFDITLFLPLIEDDLYFPRGRITNTKELKFNIINIPFKSSTFNLRNFTNRIAEAVEKYDPEFLFLGDIYSIKPYLADRLKKYKTIWRFFAYELICPKINLIDSKGNICSGSFLTTPKKCRKCLEEDFDINWSQPIYREIRMANIFSSKYQNILRNNLGKAIRLIVYNDILEKRLKDGLPNLQNISLIPSGIDPEKYCTENKEKKNTINILFPGRVEDSKKGFDYFINIFRKVKQKYPQVSLILTGKIKIEEKGIEWVGWIPHEEMLNLYKRCDICVIPSVWEEPFGIVALEAMAAAIPVIANDVGGIKHIINHGKNGFLISPKDPKKFYNYLTKLITDKELRKKMGEEGKKRAADYAWKEIIEKYDKIFRLDFTI